MMSPQRNKEEAGRYVFDKKYEILIYLPTRKWNERASCRHEIEYVC